MGGQTNAKGGTVSSSGANMRGENQGVRDAYDKGENQGGR